MALPSLGNDYYMAFSSTIITDLSSIAASDKLSFTDAAAWVTPARLPKIGGFVADDANDTDGKLDWLRISNIARN